MPRRRTSDKPPKPRHGDLTARLPLRVRPDQARAWRAAAAAQGLTLAEWMREHLDAAAGIDRAGDT